MKKSIFYFVLLFAFGSLHIAGQTINGTIIGTATDPQGAVVPGATVTVLNNETGLQRVVTTNDEGHYRVPGLPGGVYTVRIEKAGYASVSRNDVNVSSAVETEVSLSMQAGQVQAEVEVTAAGELLDTSQSQVQHRVDSQRILSLPGGNTQSGLALLNPGVVPNQNNRPGSGFSVNGNRTRSNNFTIDGANNNDQSLSIPRQNLPAQAIAEFQIITNTPSAEFGRNAGSYVNQITRSGTNDFSGSAFYNWAGNEFNALTTAQQRSFNFHRTAGRTEEEALRLSRNLSVSQQYGGAIGGPIKKNHTFFFASVDFAPFRTTVGRAARPALTAESRALLQANRNNFLSPAAVDFILATYPASNDPTLPGTSEANSTVNVTTTTGLTLPLLFRTYNRTLDQAIAYGTDFSRFMGKIDTKLNSKDQLSFRYLYNQSDDPGAPASLPGLEIGSVVKDQSFTVNDAYLFTSNFLNEFRMTYSRRDISFPEDLGAFAGGVQLAVFGTFGAFSGGNANFPQFRNDRVWEFTDNVSYTSGNHNLKFGYNLLRYRLGSFFAPVSRGFAQYNSFGDLLADRAVFPQNATGDFLVDAVTYEHSFFGQDNWKVNNDLTLNLGLRYEYVTVPYGYFSNAKADVNNFGPRLGFAWNPKDRFGGNFVLRGAFGVAYDQVFQNILLNVSRNYPRVIQNAISSCTGCLLFSGFGNIPATGTVVPLGETRGLTAREYFNRTTVPAADIPFLAERLFAANERIKQPMSLQWTLGVQYQFPGDLVFKAEYIGTKGTNLVREVEQNFGFVAAAGGTGRMDPNRGSILVGQGIADSIYHSGQFTLERRLNNFNVFGLRLGQLTFNANYTYSSFISESDDILGGQANRTLPSDPRAPELDRARSAFDIPHRFVLSMVYRTPEVGGNWFAKRLLGGWELAAISTARSGTPFSILSNTNPLGILPGQISTVQLSQRVGVNPNGIPGTFDITNRFGVPVYLPDAYYLIYPTNSGLAGNLGANTERTPSVYDTDLRVAKDIRLIGERMRLQFFLDVFNVFNRRNFTVNPTNTLNYPATPAGQPFPSRLSVEQANSTFLNVGLTNVSGRSFNFGARFFF